MTVNILITRNLYTSNKQKKVITRTILKKNWFAVTSQTIVEEEEQSFKYLIKKCIKKIKKKKNAKQNKNEKQTLYNL